MSTMKSVYEYHDLIEAIVAALEARDPHTSHHSKRVSDMTTFLCERLGLSSEEAGLYHIAADLHDIGKIGVPDSVLLKEGRLDEEQWRQMQAHTIIGSDILSKVESFGMIARIVRHHHERWDGKGYPDGLNDHRIPIGARIIAVADSVDAMLSNRSYRRSLSPEICRTEIEKNLGIMYDPEVAQCALENWAGLLLARSASTALPRENV